MKDLIQKFNLHEKTVYAVCRTVAVVAAVFSLIICVLLIANYLQTRAIDPLHSQALETLVKRLDQNPGDAALREQIRALHLLSRKAYFVHQWQLRSGGVLLLIGVIVMLAALKIMQNLQRQAPNPEDFPDSNNAWEALEQARNWVVGLSVFILGLAVIFAILSYREMSGAFAESGETETIALNNEPLKFWPNFRGPGGNGVANAEDVPGDGIIDSAHAIVWKVPVPRPGLSSPVVWENHLFLTGGDKHLREVYCFDTASGEILWQRAVGFTADSASLPDLETYPGYASPSVATNGRYVCAIFASGELICFDMTGNEIWTRDLGIPDNHYGHASSLIMYQQLLFVQYDQNSNSKLYALEAATGKTAWEVPRSDISWSSPICVNTENGVQLILANSKTVDAYDPQSGRRLWTLDCMGGEMGPSPAFAGGMVYAANENAAAVAIRLNGSQPEIAWEFDGDLPDTASPLATDRYVFLATSYGLLSCLDAKTGEKLWEAELDYGCYASPVLAGNRVYAMDSGGVLVIFEPGDTYQPVAEISLGEKSDCTPAIVGGRIYVRGKAYLYCIVLNQDGT